VTLSVGTSAAEADALASVLPNGFPLAPVRDDTVYLPASAYPPFFPDSRVRLTGPDGRVRNLAVEYIDGLQVPSLVSPATLNKVSKAADIRLDWIAFESGIDRAKTVDEIAGIAILDNQQPVAGPAILDIRAAGAISTAQAAALAILTIAILVAVVGAAATAALSITERAREHATLRALGLPRSGLGKLLATRVLFIGALAALLGTVVGSVLGVVVARLLVATLGLDPVIAWPLVPVAIVALATVLAVRAAALLPMERASYIPPSRALAQG